MRGHQRGRPSVAKSSGGGGGMKSHFTNISRNVKSLESKMKQRQHDYNRGRQPTTTPQDLARSSSNNQRQRSNSANNNKKQSDKKQLLMINYSKHHEQQQRQTNKSVSSSDSGTDIVPPSNNNNIAAQPSRSQRGRTSKLSRPSFLPRVGRHTNNDEEEFHMSGGANYFTSHNSSSSNNNRPPRITNRLKRLHNPNGSEWILPINYKYNSRVDIWLLLTISSCAALSSIGLVFSSNTTGIGIGNSPKYALSTTILSFIISLVISIGLRYAPLRMGLTTNIMPLPTLSSSYNNHLSPRHSNSKRCLRKGQQLLLYKMNITYELLLLSLLCLLWVIALPIIVNGEVYYMNGNIPLAMSGTSIYNANIFYSSYISTILCIYLWIDIYTSYNRRCIVKIDQNIDPSRGESQCSPDDNNQASTTTSSSNTPNNTYTKRWSLLFINTLTLLSSSIVVYNSSSCSNGLLRSTNYCKYALLSIIFGGLLQLLLCFVVAGVYRLSYMTSLQRDRFSSSGSSNIVSLSKRNNISSTCALLTLLIQSINTGLITSSSNGGPGNNVGVLYYTCWINFLLGCDLCLRYLDYYSTTREGESGGSSRGGSSRNSRLLLEDVTVYEDEDEHDVESYLMIQQQQQQNATTNNRNRVVVEDASDDESNDQQSFLFLPAPDIKANKHFGGGQDPDADVLAADYIAAAERQRQQELEQQRRRSSSNPSSSDPKIGSIDAKSLKTDSKSTTNGEEVNDRIKKKQQSGFSYEDEDLNNSAFFDDQFNKNVPQNHTNNDNTRSNRVNEPDAMKMLSKSIVLTNFQNNQVEQLDDDQPLKTSNSHDSQFVSSKKSSNLSPLEEGSCEISPTSGNGMKSSSQVGDNLKTMRAMQGVIDEVHQHVAATTARTRSRSRSHSRERKKNLSPQDNYFPQESQQQQQGLSSLPAMGGMEGLTLKTTGQSTVSRMTMPSMSTQSRSLYTDKTSVRGEEDASRSHLSGEPSTKGGGESQMSGPSTKAGGVSQMSAATQSAASQSTSRSSRSSMPSTVHTDDDDSGSNLPLTDDESGSLPSTKDDQSNSLPSTKSKSVSSRNNKSKIKGGNKPPPPPPFRRSPNIPQSSLQQPDFDATSQYTASAPIRAVLPSESDSIVSDPTLDPGLVDPGPIHVPQKMMTQPPMHNNSSSTDSMNKKYSDETDLNHSPRSDSDNPSSKEGGAEGSGVVDNIVAAALAYAEKAHGESDNRLRLKHSGTTASSRVRPPISKQINPLRASTNTDVSGGIGSIHSFFSNQGSKPDEVVEAADVDDLVAKALSHAQGQLDSSGGKKKQQQQLHQQSEKSIKSKKSLKSTHSMYSEDGSGEFSNDEEFDC